MSKSERTTRINEINRVLAALSLKPLKKLGDFTRGEFELVSIHGIHDHSKQFFTDIKFVARMPKTGNPGFFTLRFNANGVVSDGAVISVLINGKFAIVKQWRPALSCYTHELMRGFGGTLQKARDNGELGKLAVSDLPLPMLSRELGADVMESAEVVSITFLGEIAENSGTHNVTPSHFLVQLKVDPAKLASRLETPQDGLDLQLWSAKTLKTEFGGKLCDNHSITGAALALAHLEGLAEALRD